MKLITRLTEGTCMPYGLSYMHSIYTGWRVNLRFRLWRKYRKGYDIRYMCSITDWWSYDVIIRVMVPARRLKLWPRINLYHDWTLED